MPQPYFLLWNYLLCELPKLTTSSRIHLDMVLSSPHIAPHVLWDPTGRNSLFGSDRSENVRGSDFSFYKQIVMVIQKLGLPQKGH